MLRRGRCEEPVRVLRIRSCTRARVMFFEYCVNICCSSGLSALPGTMPGRQPIRKSKFGGFKAAPRTTVRISGRALLRARLANLLLEALAHVAHALTFVGVGRSQGAHLSGHLAHLLPI